MPLSLLARRVSRFDTPRTDSPPTVGKAMVAPSTLGANRGAVAPDGVLAHSPISDFSIS